MTHTGVADLYLAQSAKGSRKDNFKPTLCSPVLWSSNLCPAATVLREIQAGESSQCHVRLQSILSAGDCPPLLEEESSAIPGTGFCWLCPPASVMPSLCPWEVQLLVVVGSEDCQGAWPGFHLPGEQNTLPYRTNSKDTCWQQKTASLSENSLLGGLGPG